MDRSFFRRKSNEKGGVSDFLPSGIWSSASSASSRDCGCLSSTDWSPLRTVIETMYWVYNLMGLLPTFLISFAIIAFGIYLVRGKKPPQGNKRRLNHL